MRIHFVIPTTDGPVRILRLTRRPNLPVSIVVAEGDFRPLAFSDAYSRLTASGGPLSAIVAAELAGGYELRLDRAIESGRSWEAPVALAHALTARGHVLADRPEGADLVAWTTGALDSDLAIVPMDYGVAEKLRRSAELFAGLADAGARAFVGLPFPADPATEARAKALAPDPPHRVATILRVQDAIDILGAAPAAMSRPLASPPESGATPRTEARLPSRALIAAAGLMAALAASWAVARHSPALFGLAPPGPVASPAGVAATGEVFHAPATPTSVAPIPATVTPAPVASPARAPAAAVSPEPIASAKPAPSPSPAAPAPAVELPRVVLTELRAPQGSSCSDVLYGDAQAEPRVAAQDSPGEIAPSDRDGLCGIEIDATGAGPGWEFTVDPALLAAGHREAEEPGTRPGRFRSLRLRLRDRRTDSLDYKITVYGPGGGAPKALSHSLRNGP
jgi:hypothetical protein